MKHRRWYARGPWSSDYHTFCGAVVDTKDCVSNDLKVTCPECLKLAMIQREQELEQMKEKLEEMQR